MPNILSSAHMRQLVNTPKLKERITLAKKVLKDVKFDTIAFRGMSGSFLGPALAMALKKDMILVRKDNDDSHSHYSVEGNLDAKKYVIVDDFIFMGYTKRAIIDSVKKFAPDASFVGLLQVDQLTKKGIEEYLDKGQPYPLS